MVKENKLDIEAVCRGEKGREERRNGRKEKEKGGAVWVGGGELPSTRILHESN